MDQIRVDGDSGCRGADVPSRLGLPARCVTVREVIDRRLAPDHRYFIAGR